MRGVMNFLKATVVGGLIFLIPIMVIVFIVGKAMQFSMKVAQPMAGFIPVESVAGIALANLIGGAVIVLACFVAGILARNSMASNLVREAEARFLWKLPAYSFVKGVTDSFAVGDETATLKPVLAKLDDASQIGFEVERLSDGRVVVYVPGAPDPQAGSVLIMTEDRVEPLGVPMVTAMQNMRALGRGTKDFLPT